MIFIVIRIDVRPEKKEEMLRRHERAAHRLEPVDDGARVTSYCDWSDIHPDRAAKNVFPIIPESALTATLGILARTVQKG